MDVAGVVTGSGQVPAGDAGVANLPVTGATATTDRPLFPLLIVAALLFGVAGKVTRMTGRRS